MSEADVVVRFAKCIDELTAANARIAELEAKVETLQEELEPKRREAEEVVDETYLYTDLLMQARVVVPDRKDVLVFHVNGIEKIIGELIGKRNVARKERDAALATVAALQEALKGGGK